MRTSSELAERIERYHGLWYICREEGSIVWHLSTGDNIEVLFIEAQPGHGQEMLRRMAHAVEGMSEEPYHSVFAFCLAGNERGRRFWRDAGWREIELGRSIYRDDETVLFWIPWDELKRSE
jgi:hypothetical protein